MQKRFLWKIGGEAGFGIQTTGLMYSKIATRMGYHIFDYFEYPSLIRGGHNTTETLISDEEVTSTKRNVDLLVCLNKATYELHKKRLSEASVVVYDDGEFQIEDDRIKKVPVPFKQMLKQEEALLVMMNNIALGASLALMGWDLTIVNEMIEQSFSKKGADVVTKNKKMALLGFDHILANFQQFVCSDFPYRQMYKQMVLTGNDAFALGAIAADCKLYSAYPMTPSSTVLTTLAAYAEKTGMVVRHAEDEISVINTALGSSWAGVRSAVGTSGGGFALMVESLSFAGVAEIPIVVFLSQRPGPATGLPTWTEQGDLLFAVHAGHGEFPKIVLAPGDIDEMYTQTGEAFDLADKYQTPVIILSDKLLSESHLSIPAPRYIEWAQNYTPDRGNIVADVATGDKTGVNSAVPFIRYQITENGISPMLIPGKKGLFYQSNSYEHVEDGHTTEDATERKRQFDKRNKKMQVYLDSHFKMPAIYGTPLSSSVIFVSWGSTKLALLEALKQLDIKGISASLYHFTHLYPLDRKKIRELFKMDKRYILVENNGHAQFGRLLEQETGVHIDEKILKYDGRPIWTEEIVEYVTQ